MIKPFFSNSGIYIHRSSQKRLYSIMATKINKDSSTFVWTPQGSIPKLLKERIKVIQSYQPKNPNDKNIPSLLTFLTILQQLKTTRRTGWLDYNVKDPESIADHMYRMGVISMLSNDTALDTQRCVLMALVHDMAEALVGDITPKDPIPKHEKHRRELATIDYLTESVLKPFNAFAANEIHGLWSEYENSTTPEAKFVKSVDKFELLVQTLEFEQNYNREKDLSQFIDVRNQIKTKEVMEWADVLINLRSDYWKGDTTNTASKKNEEAIEKQQWSPEGAIHPSVKPRLDCIDNSVSIQQYVADTKSISGLPNVYKFLHLTQHLKATRRTGWVDHKVDDPESIADHMYRMGIICMLTNNKNSPKLDTKRCVLMAIVHDMAECIVGDITPQDRSVSKAEKHDRELAAMKYLTQTLLKPFNPEAADTIFELWNEYENLSTVEARFVMDIDKFELLVQMLEYEIQHEKERDLSQFQSVRKSIKTEEVGEWADAVLEIRKNYWE